MMKSFQTPNLANVFFLETLIGWPPKVVKYQALFIVETYQGKGTLYQQALSHEITARIRAG